MYLICPRCKKLIDENEEVCPYCGRRFAPKDPHLINLWWCNYCEIYVTPLSGGSPIGSTELVIGLAQALDGDMGSAYIASELGNLKRKTSKNPNNYRCPKCGGTNLQKWKPQGIKEPNHEALKLLQIRFVKGEITKSEYLEMKKLIQED